MNRHIKVFWLAAAALCIVFMMLFVGIRFMLPNDIALRSGERTTIDLNLPLKGSLLCEDMAVSSVNDKPVTGGINIDMSSPVTFKAQNAGKALLKLSFCGIPLKNSTINVLPDTRLIPCGRAVGLELQTDGVLVLGTGEVRTGAGRYVNPCLNKLKSGDMLKKADNVTLSDKESLIKYVENCRTDEVTLMAERRGELFTVKVKPVLSSESGKKKIGLWVRDGTQGIGTMTCYDKNGKFYALGHPVTDVDTGEIMQIRCGKIMPTSITAVNTGKKGSPGELVGSTDKQRLLGRVTSNTSRGISGILSLKPKNVTAYKIALRSEVKKGRAQILATVNGSTPRHFDIEIESTNTLSGDASKAMVIKITDKELIAQTGGIVQGMSGAPIMQDGKIVGAVTHVFIQEPTRGYGIFIEDMIK